MSNASLIWDLLLDIRMSLVKTHQRRCSSADIGYQLFRLYLSSFTHVGLIEFEAKTATASRSVNPAGRRLAYDATRCAKLGRLVESSACLGGNQRLGVESVTSHLLVRL